MNVLVGR